MKGVSLSPPIPSGKKGNNFIISKLKERLLSLLQTFREERSQFPETENGNRSKRPIFVLLTMCLCFVFKLLSSTL